jgi:excinuclease UvrABC nuclease subunit
MSNCNWPYSDKEKLSFGIYDINSNWSSSAGLYIFAYRTSETNWSCLYIGQTNDFAARFANHEKLNTAIRRGATHIHALVVPLQKDRDYYEEKLIQYLQPPMNEQLRDAGNY